MKKIKNLKQKLPLLVIGASAVIAFTLVVTFSLQSRIWDQTASEAERLVNSKKSDKVSKGSDDIGQLSPDTKKAVVSEISNIEKDLDSVSDPNIDDLSGIENEI